MQRLAGWILFGVFALLASAAAWNEQTLDFSGPYGIVKGLIWAMFLGFLGYSVYCSRVENIFKTIRLMSQRHWGRQIGVDLYLGLTLFLVFVYLHQGSLLLVALWIVPVLLFANLATLLYLALFFES